jgi:hypothetical protein
MNKNTKIILALGAPALLLLFLFRKQIFGGGSDNDGGSEDTTPDTTGPSENVEVPKETGGDTALKPFVPPPVPTQRPDLTKVNTTTASNTNLAPRVDTPTFFTAPSPFALGGR